MGAVLSPGDILEFDCPGGVAYFSYAGKHASLGDAIWVVPRVFPQPTDDWSSAFGGEGYFAFYPATSAVRRKLVRKVGFAPAALRLLPTKRRNVVNVDAHGAVTSWLITDGTVRVPRRDSELSSEERNLPIANIWNHKFLVESIGRGWTP
jgi:hypothetical protein